MGNEKRDRNMPITQFWNAKFAAGDRRGHRAVGVKVERAQMKNVEIPTDERAVACRSEAIVKSGASGSGLLRLPRYERVAEDLKQPRLALPTGTAERIDRRADVDLAEPAFLQHTPPTCARQATGNSVGP